MKIHPPFVMTMLVSSFFLFRFQASDVSLTTPLTTSYCSPWNSPTVVCIERYSSLTPYHFNRTVAETYLTEATDANTNVPPNSFFELIASANFLVFDETLAYDILGPNPSLSLEFRRTSALHEAPVFVPGLNKLLVSQIGAGLEPMLIIELDQSPPYLAQLMFDPPLTAPLGGYYHNGLIWYSTAGGRLLDGSKYGPGIYTVDPSTWRATARLINCSGYCFNGCDDLVLDSKGDVWFTDKCKLLSKRKVVNQTNLSQSTSMAQETPTQFHRLVRRRIVSVRRQARWRLSKILLSTRME